MTAIRVLIGDIYPLLRQGLRGSRAQRGREVLAAPRHRTRIPVVVA